MIYLDTSWLVKLYVSEPDSALVRRIVDAAEDVLVSEIAFVEFHSAVARRRRDGSLTAAAADGVVALFRDEWPTRTRVAVSAEVIARAADIVSSHPVRTIDALQLASATLVAAGAPEPLEFGSADGRLNAAARAEGLRVLVPADRDGAVEGRH